MVSPYELRFSIFNTAKDILIKQHEANLAAWELLNKTSKKAEEVSIKFPTIEEIVEKAIEINKFISDTQSHEFGKIAKRLTGTTVIF
jgi:hypothetical protein